MHVAWIRDLKKLTTASNGMKSELLDVLRLTRCGSYFIPRFPSDIQRRILRFFT